MARALGINVSAIKTAIFALGSFMAGFAGGLNLPLSSASLGADAEATVLAFIIVIIGGVGSIMGTFIAALIVGIVDSLGILVVLDLPLWLFILLWWSSFSCDHMVFLEELHNNILDILILFFKEQI
jgi:branched-subunit amino acid ABC-type transport system permease component